MIKKLTFSAVLLTMFVLASNSANAGYFSDNSHIDGNMDYLKNYLTKNVDVHEKTSEPTPVPIQIQKPKIVKAVAKISVVKTYTVVATAYSSTPDQTDGTPCIAASGYNVCTKTENIIAVSRDLVRLLGYGTQVRFPELYGQKVFQIEDTMNMRFTDRIDFHLDSREEAKNFGFKRGVKMEVI